MPPIQIALDFVDSAPPARADRFIANLPSRISTKADLLFALYNALRMPGYFGYNWDALADTLRDLDWLPQKHIVLVHSDVPLICARERKEYLNILIEALEDWPAGSEKQFRVVFPTQALVTVTAALKD